MPFEPSWVIAVPFWFLAGAVLGAALMRLWCVFQEHVAQRPSEK